MYLERQLWQNDGHEYVHEAYRVFISGKLKCHVYTPARLGEVSEGSTRKGTGHGLRYRVRFLVSGLFQYHWLITIGHCDAGRLEGR
jgi:hypothetical protein